VEAVRRTLLSALLLAALPQGGVAQGAPRFAHGGSNHGFKAPFMAFREEGRGRVVELVVRRGLTARRVGG